MKNSYKEALLYVLFFVTLLLLQPHAGQYGDLLCWTGWASYIKQNGLGNIYQADFINYNPLYMYVLWLFGKIVGTVEKIQHYGHQLKAFTLVFDFAGAILAARLVEEKERRFMLTLLLLCNIGYLYNTLIWQQVDSIVTFFALAAVVLAMRGQTVWSLLMYVLAFNTKTQAIIFLPAMLLLWLPQWIQLKRRQLPVALVLGAVLQLAILSPFIWGSKQNDISRIIDINLKAADTYPVITMNAYNFWVLLFQNEGLRHAYGPSDLLTYGSLTYRQWGMLMFMAAAVVVLLPVLLLMVRNFLARRLPTTLSEQALILLSCGLLPLIFTYFNTQMHERYWHPAILFIAGHAFITRRYWLFIVFCFAYFLQLEVVLQFLMLKKYSILFFDPNFILGLFTLCIVGGLIELYRVARVGVLIREIKGYWQAERVAVQPVEVV